MSYNVVSPWSLSQNITWINFSIHIPKVEKSMMSLCTILDFLKELWWCENEKKIGYNILDRKKHWYCTELSLEHQDVVSSIEVENVQSNTSPHGSEVAWNICEKVPCIFLKLWQPVYQIRHDTQEEARIVHKLDH